MSNYQRVRRLILLRIESGDWPPGFRLPSTTALAAEFAVSVSLINNVMRSLEEAEIIRGRAGVARFVAGGESNDDDNPVDTGLEAS